MGLFRLFWVPAGMGATAGGYVRYPADELLDILALESHRARAFVVGEDLGTVEDAVRHELHERHVLSYRLLWFEPGPPSSYPEQALAAVTTHDLPTIAGLWTGADDDDQRAAGVTPNEEAEGEVRRRLREAAEVDDDAPVADVVLGAYRALSGASSRVLLATLDDALCVTARPNLPGTLEERPNWSLALPRPIEELDAEPGPAAIARCLDERRG
jgi:4-alpha-glucanotransferase